MSHLSILNKLKKDTLLKKHPLVNQDLDFRYGYCFGVAFLASADNVLEDKEKEAMEDLLRSLELPAEYLGKILQAAKEPNEDMIKGLIESLQKKSHKYLFLADLYRMSISDSTVSSEEEEVVASFAELLGVANSERLLLKELVLASENRDMEKIADEICALIKKQLLEQAHVKFTDGITRGIYKHAAVILIEIDQRDGRKKISLLEHNVKYAANWQIDKKILKFVEVYYCETNQVSLELLHEDMGLVLGDAVVDISSDEQILFVDLVPYYYARFKFIEAI